MRVSLDTNVLVNLLNPAKNTGSYLTKMVSDLVRAKETLCLDLGERIDKEYHGMLDRAVRNLDPTESTIRQLLKLFVDLGKVPYEHVERIKVDKTDNLMRCIGRHIPLEEDLDRVFVYVAAKAGATLVTDDFEHILSDDGSRELELKKCAERFGDINFDLMDTRSAKAAFERQP